MIRAALAAIPLLALPVAAYALLALTLGGGFAAPGAADLIARPFVGLARRGGGRWGVSAADLLLGAGLVIAFLDLVRRPPGRRAAIANLVLSAALFLTCLGAMLLEPAFAGSAFFLLTLMVLLNLAGGLMAASEGGAKRR